MAQARFSLVRLVLVGLVAVAATVQVVRSAIVSEYVVTRPDLAARAWPGHPAVMVATAMGGIGRAAAAGAGTSEADIARAMAAARRSPLLVEPLLIKGAEAIVGGNSAAAERLFREARRRDPRSTGARYFLAQYYLSNGRAEEGLADAVVLSRLVPGGGNTVIPGLVQYAHAPGAGPKLRKIIANDPELGGRLVMMLADDPANAALVIELAGALPPPAPGTIPDWQTHILSALIKAGDFPRARVLWTRLSGLRSAPSGLFNPNFAAITAPPPFNWSFGSGNFGVAEPGPGGLQTLYYGRDDGQFASELLVLRPGRYRLQMTARRDQPIDQPSALAWRLTCQPGAQKLFTAILPSEGGQRAMSADFTVPAGCPSQLLSLDATARDFAANEQVAISNLQLVEGVN